MGALGLVVKIGALRLGFLREAFSRAVGLVLVPGQVRRELASRNGAAARLAILVQAQQEARLYGLSDEALGLLLVELGKDVREGRFRR